MRARTDRVLEFVAAQEGAGTLLLGNRVPWGAGIAGAAWVGRVPLMIRDVQAEPRHDCATDEETGFRTRGLVAVPVRADGVFFAVFERVNRVVGGIRPWHEDVVESLFRAIAGRLSGSS